MAGALSVSVPLSILKPDAQPAEYQGTSSQATFHVFVNETEEHADLSVQYNSAGIHSQGSVDLSAWMALRHA
jgi:hypothetical protein